MVGADGVARCFWRYGAPEYHHYHDHEWGRPLRDPRRLFEKICLEGFQSGLSWLTILRKRPAFRAAFHDFDAARIARYDEADVARLLADADIVRNRSKILSVINNARRAGEFEGGGQALADWLWSFAPPPAERPATVDLAWLRQNPTAPASHRLSKALKARGWSFVGPTTIYAFMQAVGMVDDHFAGCAARAGIAATSEAGPSPPRPRAAPAGRRSRP